MKERVEITEASSGEAATRRRDAVMFPENTRLRETEFAEGIWVELIDLKA